MGQDVVVGGVDYCIVMVEVFLCDFVKQIGVEYILLIEVLCNEDGCLICFDFKSGEMFYLDIVYFMLVGLCFIVDLIVKQLLQDLF